MSKLDNDELTNVSGGLQHDGSSKIFKLGKKELKMLFDAGYVDEKGCILKNNLEKAQRFLQREWNGIFYIKGDDFDQLPEMINLSEEDSF